tara:strand:+ start:9520 stop:10029 length:510 start_codon:yes stop_codon:yes gene_type:complete
MYHKGKPMSRCPSGAADADSRAIFELSRRQIIAGSLALAAVRDIPARMDPSVDACRAWLALEEEHQALIRRWQALDTYLIRERYWCDLSRQQYAVIPEAVELEAIEHRLEALYETRQELLATLPNVPATTQQGLVLKLAILAIIVMPDENEQAHNLIMSALHDLETSAV